MGGDERLGLEPRLECNSVRSAELLHVEGGELLLVCRSGVDPAFEGHDVERALLPAFDGSDTRLHTQPRSSFIQERLTPVPLGRLVSAPGRRKDDQRKHPRLGDFDQLRLD